MTARSPWRRLRGVRGASYRLEDGAPVRVSLPAAAGPPRDLLARLSAAYGRALAWDGEWSTASGEPDVTRGLRVVAGGPTVANAERPSRVVSISILPEPLAALDAKAARWGVSRSEAVARLAMVGRSGDG